MNLIVFNGSPRGSKSNSKVVTDWMLEHADLDVRPKEFYLAKAQKQDEAVGQVEDGATLLVLFPLYTDSMPAITKLFFEKLEKRSGELSGVKVYFVVQSGFSGANHSRYVEKYLVYLSKQLGFEYMGTAVKPSGEGLRSLPPMLTRRTRKLFAALGQDVAAGRPFDGKKLRKLAKYEKPGFVFKFLLEHTGISDKMLSGHLKHNGVFEKRFDTPYLD